MNDRNASRFQVIHSINGTFVGRMQYAPTILPENALIFLDMTFTYPPNASRFLFLSCTRPVSPASAEALIFFCLLFLYQDKKRRYRHDEYTLPNTILMMMNAQNVIRFWDIRI